MSHEDALDKAALRFAAIVESSDLAIYSQQLDGTITSWNRASEALFGFTALDVLGKPSSAIMIPPDRRAEEAEVLERIRAGHGVQHYETIRQRKDGTLVDVSITVSPLRTAAGEIVGLSKVARDITNHKRVEYQSKHLAAIVTSSEDAIISKDLNGTISSWNRAAEKLFGYAAPEAIGRSIRMIIPDDRQDEEDYVLGQIRRGQAVKHFETVRRRKDGTLVPISLTVSPIRTDAGEIIGASKIARDITEKKRAEQRAAFLAEASHLLTSSLDYTATLTAVATLAVPSIADWCAVDVVTDAGKVERLAVAHVDPAKMEIVRTIRECYEDPDSPYSVAAVVRTARPTIVPRISDEMIQRAARGDGECIRLLRLLGLASYIGVPLVAHGRTLGALSFVSAESKRQYTDEDLRFAEDVAFRVALAIDNARAYEAAQFANRLKDDFLATFSHELRTPLNAILGYSRMLQSGVITAGAKQKRALQTVERNATVLSQIVEDVLDVSRIVSGKLRLNIEPVDLPHVVKQAIETVRPAVDAKHIRVETIVDPGATPVSGDPDRLQQIVWNLLSNAVKFTPKGGRVQIRLERINSHVEITVSDSGIGIDPDFLPHIFERFRQADSGTSREHTGLGLGLGIARHLVELHGGTIHATSDGEGHGATFQVRLPVMMAQAGAPTVGERRMHPHSQSNIPTGPVPTLAGVRVLTVDDDSDALTLGRDILEAAGAIVTTCDSGIRALEEIRAVRPDVLIADVGLPRMDGYELIKRIRQLPDGDLREIPAAALTAYARAEDRVKSLQSGFHMHLAKPIDPAELVVVVAALAKRAHDRDAE